MPLGFRLGFSWVPFGFFLIRLGLLLASRGFFLGPLEPLFTFFSSSWTRLGFLDFDFAWDPHGLPSLFLASLSVLLDSFWIHLGFFFWFFFNSIGFFWIPFRVPLDYFEFLLGFFLGSSWFLLYSYLGSSSISLESFLVLDSFWKDSFRPPL